MPFIRYDLQNKDKQQQLKWQQRLYQREENKLKKEKLQQEKRQREIQEEIERQQDLQRYRQMHRDIQMNKLLLKNVSGLYKYITTEVQTCGICFNDSTEFLDQKCKHSSMICKNCATQLPSQYCPICRNKDYINTTEPLPKRITFWDMSVSYAYWLVKEQYIMD